MLSGLFKFFLAGGFFMWPILLCSILSVALIIYTSINLISFNKKMAAFFLFLAESGQAGSGDIGRLEPSVFTLRGDAKRFQDAMVLAEEQVQLSFDKAGGTLELLSGLGGLAPLLGFMGTVSGMIVSFAAIASADKVSVKLVAGGISEALITTGFGLIVAIACMFADSLFRYYLTSRAHRATEEMTRASNKAGVPLPDAALEKIEA